MPKAKTDAPTVTSQRFKGQEVLVPETAQVVRFDGNGRCVGIVRQSGGHPFPKPKPLTGTILDEMRKHPGLFNTDRVDAEVPAEDMPGIGPELADALGESGINTVADVKKASDQELLSQPGIGPKRLRTLREKEGMAQGDVVVPTIKDVP